MFVDVGKGLPFFYLINRFFNKQKLPAKVFKDFYAIAFVGRKKREELSLRCPHEESQTDPNSQIFKEERSKGKGTDWPEDSSFVCFSCLLFRHF